MEYEHTSVKNENIEIQVYGNKFVVDILIPEFEGFSMITTRIVDGHLKLIQEIESATLKSLTRTFYRTMRVREKSNLDQKLEEMKAEAINLINSNLGWFDTVIVHSI